MKIIFVVVQNQLGMMFVNTRYNTVLTNIFYFVTAVKG